MKGKNGWIEVTNIGTGKQTLVNVAHIMWIAPAQQKGREFGLIKTNAGTIFTDEDYDLLKADIEEALE